MHMVVRPAPDRTFGKYNTSISTARIGNWQNVVIPTAGQRGISAAESSILVSGVNFVLTPRNNAGDKWTLLKSVTACQQFAKTFPALVRAARAP